MSGYPGKYIVQDMTSKAVFSVRQHILRSLLYAIARQCWNWRKRTGGGQLHGDWNLKPIFTQKWASIDMNWVGATPIPWQFQPCYPSALPSVRSSHGISQKHRSL